MSLEDGMGEKHESFGLIGISRITGGHETLFGSSIKHSNTIRIEIKPAKRFRDLNTDWYHENGIPYIEIEMSPTQFAEAITTLNHSPGIPVTIKYINGKALEPCPDVNKRQQFENEFKKDMEDIRDKLDKLTKEATEILSSKKNITIAERNLILDQIRSLKQEIGSNLPYVNKMFNEQMDKTVLEAKGETEAFFINKINQLGLSELKKQQKFIE
jgi:hypothetical protein